MKSSGWHIRDSNLNTEDPIIIATINVAKIKPCGIVASGASCLIAIFKDGVHIKTKVYIEPSKKLWIKPKQKTGGSKL